MQNENRPVELQFNISLQQIIDLDERNQVLKSNMWLKYYWYDENLVWNEVSKTSTSFFCLKLILQKMPDS